jgi:predicted nucleic acid-binding protein
LRFYLDSSAWVKRYLGEVGSLEIDLVFKKAIEGSHTLVSSFWNVGECLGVFVKRRRRGELRDEEFGTVLRNFISETVDLVERGSLLLVPASNKLLEDCWKIILENDLYQADALQIQTARAERCDFIITADEQLAEAAKRLGVGTISIEKSEDRIRLHELMRS